MSENDKPDQQPDLPDKNRRDYYQKRAQEVLDKFGNNFE